MTVPNSVPAPYEDGILLLEAPFARVPHDELRRHLRTQQRHVERDLTFCSSTLNAIGNSSATNENALLQIGDISQDGDASILGDVSYASDAVQADDSILSSGDRDATQETALINKKGSELDKSLDMMIGRIKGLKRKLTSVQDMTESTLNRLEDRTKHLNDLHNIQSTASPSFEDWCRTRLDRMLVDWLLRKGHHQSAEMLARTRQIENFTELNLFTEMARIEASLSGYTQEDGSYIERSCGPTLAWCSENKSALRKIKATLEFDLRLQEFIEMTRNRTPGSLSEALAYSRRHLLSYMNTPSKASDAELVGKGKPDDKEDAEEREQQETLRKAVSRALGLLACGPSSWAYAELYSTDRWDALREKFRRSALQIHSLPRQPLLHIALSAGLSSLKLPSCYSNESKTAPPAHLGGRAFGDERSNLLSVAGMTETSVSAPTFPPAAGISPPSSPPSVVVSSPTVAPYHGDANHASDSKNNNCPVCDSQGLGVLAKEVPWSHHANSTLVCAISGKIMDENEPPMALPNGRVYSHGALKELASASHDRQTVTCPRTGESFPISSLRKVYIS